MTHLRIMQMRRLSPRAGGHSDPGLRLRLAQPWLPQGLRLRLLPPRHTSHSSQQKGAPGHRNTAIPSEPTVDRFLTWDHPLSTRGPPSDSVPAESLLVPGLLLGRKPLKEKCPEQGAAQPPIPLRKPGFLIPATTLGHM